MAGKAVELTVAGQRCRVVTTASDQELRVLAAMVEEKLAHVLPRGRPVTTQAMLLAAVALANDVREERARAEAIATHARTTLSRVLAHVEHALGEGEAPELVKARRAAEPRRLSKSDGND
jgi:cell division protein ZapA